MALGDQGLGRRIFPLTFHIQCLAFCVFMCIASVTAECAFEDVELGARPLGMGSAFVATAEGASAIFWNSAGLAQVKHRELTMSYMELYGLVSYSSVGYARPTRMGSIGFGFVSSNDVEGLYRETVLALSAAQEVYRGLDVGANAKYLSSAANTGNVRIGGGRGLALDLGCQYHVWEGLLSFGAAFQNLVGYVSNTREKVKGIPGERYSQRPDFAYKIGTGIELGHLLTRVESAVLAAELSDGDIHMGLECTFWDVVAARAGLRTGNDLTRLITMGFGLKLSALTFDYAYVGSEVGSQTSQFSVSIDW